MKHKRSRRSRIRGRKTCGWGSRKKHRGSGQRGGVGMAGTGKKAGQKINQIVKAEYFGRHGFKSLKNVRKKKPIGINLGDIERKLDFFEKEGLVEKKKGGLTVNLKGYKVLGKGKLKTKIMINADFASEEALKKIKESGSIIAIRKDSENKEEEIEE